MRFEELSLECDQQFPKHWEHKPIAFMDMKHNARPRCIANIMQELDRKLEVIKADIWRGEVDLVDWENLLKFALEDVKALKKAF